MAHEKRMDVSHDCMTADVTYAETDVLAWYPAVHVRACHVFGQTKKGLSVVAGKTYPDSQQSVHYSFRWFSRLGFMSFLRSLAGFLAAS
jgi:hypothetical protein